MGNGALEKLSGRKSRDSWVKELKPSAESKNVEGDARVLAKWRTGGGVVANGGERSPGLSSRWGLHRFSPSSLVFHLPCLTKCQAVQNG